MQAVSNEYLEMYLPLRVDRYETIADRCRLSHCCQIRAYQNLFDSGGEGRFRGGNAMRIDYAFLEPGTISIHDDRWLTKPWGVHGGGTGSRSSKILVKHSEDAQKPPRIHLGSKMDDVHVEAGDVLEWSTWGGGGLCVPIFPASACY